VTGLDDRAPHIEHQLLVCRELRIAALQERGLIGRRRGRNLRMGRGARERDDDKEGSQKHVSAPTL
jgi:hypothetical protein